MVYPQTFALNTYHWYQSFTKKVFVPGLLRGVVKAAVKALECASGVVPKSTKALEPGTVAPGTVKTPEHVVGVLLDLGMGELCFLACNVLLQESFQQNKKQLFLYHKEDHTPSPFLMQLVSTLAAFLCGHNILLLQNGGGRRGKRAP